MWLFLQPFVFLPTLSKAAFLWGIFLQKPRILVFASLPALLVVMDWPSFLRLPNQGSTPLHLTACAEPPTSNASLSNWRTWEVAECRPWCCCLERSWFAARLSLVKHWTSISTWELFFCIIMTLLVCYQLDLSFWTVDLVVVMGLFLPPLDLATRV